MEGLRGFYHRRHSRFRGIFNVVCVLVLFCFFFREQGAPGSHLLVKSLPFQFRSRGRFYNQNGGVEGRTTEVNVSSSDYRVENGGSNQIVSKVRKPSFCSGLHEHKGYRTRCEYLIANPQCTSAGFFNYFFFFYCDCELNKAIGFALLAICLAALFYLLGNTAADYFCCSLEKLSEILNLPPTVAGVSLLPLGNGAPDVFASIAAFVSTDAGAVGLNSVLGGALFVTCIVGGTVSLSVADQRIQINKRCFFRDTCFFLLALVSLLVILIDGEINVGGAIAYVSIYVVYVIFVAANEILRKLRAQGSRRNVATQFLPVKDSGLSNNNEGNMFVPSLLANVAESDMPVPLLERRVPHWMWTANVAIYSNEAVRSHIEESPKDLWGWNEEGPIIDQPPFSCSKLCAILEMPLDLPRRLTIPIIEEERWSKAYAVASASLAPMLLAFLWNSQDGMSCESGEIVYIIGALVGGILGILAITCTRVDQPPEKFVFSWVLGGFFMSIIWFYIVASELVALLVTLGVIFQIKPSILGLTVLAWGNSMGDLMSNVALAMNGKDGVQIAMSGCYAGPMFNTLVGLGISMLLGAWSKRPAPYIVPVDHSLYINIGFLMLGLVWSQIVLPRDNMHPNKLLGVGLTAIYLIFLCVRLSTAMGASSL